MLDGAENLMKADVTRNMLASGANQTMAVLVNDNVMPYSPAAYDTVMLNTYKALTFWQQGEPDNARVEWYLTHDLHPRASQTSPSELPKQRDAITHQQHLDRAQPTYSH